MMKKLYPMKQLISIPKILTITSILVLFSCGDSGKSAKNDAAKDGQNVTKISEEDKLIQKMNLIDSNQQLRVINGLAFGNIEQGISIEAIGYLDTNDQEVKIEEIYSDSKTGNTERTLFYIEGGKKFATKQIVYDNTRQPTMFTERISFYDKNEKVIYSKEREAEYEEFLSQASFKPAALFDCKFDRALRLLNEEGEFETTFQGFIETKTVDYIIVGPNTKNGFTSSLAVVMPNALTQELKSNQLKYVGKKIEVLFEKTIEGNVTYQALLNIRLVESE